MLPTRLRNLLLFGLLITAAGLSWLLRPAAESDELSAGPTGSERGFYMLDAVFSGLDETGEVVYRLAAARIEGSDSPERMSFHDVQITYGPEKEIPWHITAETAQRPTAEEKLELTGVIIESIADPPEEKTRIEAANLELVPAEQLATTNGPVRLSIGANRIDAVGLTADLRNESISLESGVSGRNTP